MSVPPRAVQLNEANDFLKKHPEVQFVDLLIADMNGVEQIGAAELMEALQYRRMDRAVGK